VELITWPRNIDRLTARSADKKITGNPDRGTSQASHSRVPKSRQRVPPGYTLPIFLPPTHQPSASLETPKQEQHF
jgi:hypothetical protein